MRNLRIIGSAIALVSLIGFIPTTSAFANGPETVTSFVCPVLGGQAGQHGNGDVIVLIGEGHYSVLGPDINVPEHATNGNGDGTPGSHQSPGEENYSPIWWDLTGPPGTP